jgi:hypothetical protein
MKMSDAPLNRKEIEIRFRLNMKRLAVMAKFLHSGIDELKQAGVFRSEGLRADLLRAMVVFLHAAFEDFVRNHLTRHSRTFTFSSASDLKKVLFRIGSDPKLFDNLFPALTELAKRRHQILHHADLQDTQHDNANPWELADDWKLIHWHLAVSAFHYRLRKATGPSGMVEERASQNVEEALVRNVEFARAMIAFGNSPSEQLKEELAKMLNALNKLQDSLKLEVEMFLGSDGKPLEGPF